MNRTVYFEGGEITYRLEIKKVKNINLRVRRDGSVYVSANRFVSKSRIDEFVRSKAELILKASQKCESLPEKIFTEQDLRKIILKLCGECYPYFEKRGVNVPQIKFRTMVSRWGSCNPQKGILTFNLNLKYAPYDCIKYVVLHEFVHFLQPNHSKSFYDELEKICPEHKVCRDKLKRINIA